MGKATLFRMVTVLQNLQEDTPSEEMKLMLPYYYKKSRE